MCITAFHPTLRFYVRASGSRAARLLIEVLYEDLGGSVNTMPIAYIAATDTWRASSIVKLHVDLRAAVATTRTAPVALRFSAEEEEATWMIDDVYVDPFKAH